MDRPASGIIGGVSIGLEPANDEGPRWVVAQAEAELIARYGGLSEYELGVSAEMFDPPSGAFVVARDPGGSVAGGVGVRAVGQRPGAGEVKRLWVEPTWRSRGVGRALMATLEDGARGLGLRVLYLAAGDRQPEAVALYEATGWVRLQEDWDGTLLPAWHIRFCKPIGPAATRPAGT